MTASTAHLPRADRRRTIVDSAVVVFSERGFAGASLEQIAKRAGITKPIVYRHFADKVDLYMAVLEEQGNEIAGRAATGTRQEEPLRGALDAFYGFFEVQPFSEQLLARAGTDTHPAVREGHDAVLRKSIDGVRGMLLLRFPELKSEDEQKRAAVDQLSEMVLSSLVSLAIWWRRNDGISRDEVVDRAVGFVEGAVPGFFGRADL